MFGSVVLDLIISMSFIYLLLGLILSVLQEILATIVQSRSANLERGIQSLFSGASLQNGQSFVAALYNHGLVRGLYLDPQRDLSLPFVLGRWTKMRLRLRKWLGVAVLKSDLLVSDPLLLPAYIPARTFSMALIDILKPRTLSGQTLREIRSQLMDMLEADPDNKAAQALLTLANDAKDDIAKFQTNVENWFNDSMDRASGWYKKYTQKILLVMGLILAITLNVDSIRIAEMLWVDKDAREGMVAAVKTYRENGQLAQPSSNQQLSQLKKELTDRVSAFQQVADETLLPVGWKKSASEYWSAFSSDVGWGLWQLLISVCGWLITAAALSLGAPFWFDTLNKFMVIRNTVKPQEKSRIEGSKDS